MSIRACVLCGEVGTYENIRPNHFTREHNCAPCQGKFRHAQVPVYQSFDGNVSLLPFEGGMRHTIEFPTPSSRYNNPVLIPDSEGLHSSGSTSSLEVTNHLTGASSSGAVETCTEEINLLTPPRAKIDSPEHSSSVINDDHDDRLSSIISFGKTIRKKIKREINARKQLLLTLNKSNKKIERLEKIKEQWDVHNLTMINIINSLKKEVDEDEVEKDEEAKAE